MKDASGNVKPVGMIIVDRGPDDVFIFYGHFDFYDDYSIIFRYKKFIDVWIHLFLNNNQDDPFVAANAPGRSA